MRIFLSGGRGMVGRNVAEHIRARAHELVAPTREQLDLGDAGSVRAALKAGRYDMVIHVAGRVGGIADNIAHPVDYLTANYDIGRNLVLAARDAGVPRLLNLASSCVYPAGHTDPLTEDMILAGPLEWTNEAYAIAKIAVLKLCAYVTRETLGLRYKTAVPCNIYGRYDKFDAARAHLVPAALAKLHRACIRGDDVVEIWGDGLARREFMYAEDLADFIWEAVERFDQLPDLLNVGLGTDHDVNAYYEAAARIVGWTGTFVHDISKPAGMRRKLVDVSRLETFGWQAQFGLIEGMQRTYDYFRDAALATVEGTTPIVAHANL